MGVSTHLVKSKDYLNNQSEKMFESKQVTWVNIPITRTVNNIVNNASHHTNNNCTNNINNNNTNSSTLSSSPKRVSWSPDLTQVRNISPRYKSSPFRFTSPNRRSRSSDDCQHFSCVSGHPCRQQEQERKYKQTTSKLPCSPQLQKVVYRAVNSNNNNSNNNYNNWRPERSQPYLSIKPTFV